MCHYLSPAYPATAAADFTNKQNGIGKLKIEEFSQSFEEAKSVFGETNPVFSNSLEIKVEGT